MVREAEQNGNAFAAIWHLDRLIATHPEDWSLYARRARARSLSDQFDKAAADYEQAEKLSSRDQVLDFQAHYALDCTRVRRWAEALWYLDRLRASPTDSSATFWDLQELALLRSEVESLLFDDGFPRDPFQSPEPR